MFLVFACLTALLHVLFQNVHKQEQEQNQVIVLLGCSNSQIQNQRIQSVLNYINSNTAPVTLYLSGGSKDGNTVSESSIMRKKIIKEYPNLIIYIDTESTNTAENFMNLNKWMNNSDTSKPDKIIITTSDFHKERAEKIFNVIIPGITPEWNLSKSNCNWCWDAEPFHMKNVDTDIVRALYPEHLND